MNTVICHEMDILYTCKTGELYNKNTNEEKKMRQKLREVQIKLMRGLLDLVILQFLKVEPMHGYSIITGIRRNFGVYFGPSTIYPLLGVLEEKGYIKSEWDLKNERPRKVYHITHDGDNLLNGTEESLTHICRRLSSIGLNRIPVNGISCAPKQPQKLT
jgi:PadR family transcriptional regulator PadR